MVLPTTGEETDPREVQSQGRALQLSQGPEVATAGSNLEPLGYSSWLLLEGSPGPRAG